MPYQAQASNRNLFFNRFIKQDLSLADDETNKNANPEPDRGPGC